MIRTDFELRTAAGVLPARAGGVILGISEMGKGAAVSVERPEQHDIGTEPDLSEPMRVRDLLRACGATSDRDQRARLMVRVADELEYAADDIAADEARAERYQQVIAGLRGQADMARVAAAFDEHEPVTSSRAC